MKHKIFLFAISVFFIGNLFATAPTITSFTPASGAVGTLVTITGTNLTTPTAFTIGGTAAIVVSNDGTTLVGMVMPGAVTGTIVITTAGGTATSSGDFTVTATPFPGDQQGDKLVGGSSGGAQQGYSVAVSADGNTAIVGGLADNYNNGAAWVYIRSGSSWTQQGNKLVGLGGTSSAQQGFSVGISADGNTAIVGGRADNAYMGAAWVYTRTGGSWSQQGSKLVGSNGTTQPMQGTSVALSADGNTAIVGGPGNYNNNGAAWVFKRSGGVWSQLYDKLTGEGGSQRGNQGTSVSLSADGKTAIVGGPWDRNGIGAAFVFIRETYSGTWMYNQQAYLVGYGNTGNSKQGTSVALSADGNTAMIGGPDDNSNMGASWVFTRSGSTWGQQGNKLVGTGSNGDLLKQGSAVSLSADGNIAIVGGPWYNTYTGAVWVYTRSGSTWSQQGNKLVGTGNTGTASQGSSVSLSADGSTAIVGGPRDNTHTGAAWVFIPCEVAISSQSTATQTLCVNGTFTAISVTATGNGISYQWYSNASNSNSGGTSLAAGNGAQTNTYTPQAAAAGTLYYYCVVTGTCGTATSAVSGAFITNAETTISNQSTDTQTQCISGTFTAITVTATGDGLTYQWYGNGASFNSGGVSLGSGNGAQTNSYTPQTTTAGTLYYYCVVTGTCGTATSTVSGAFITNPNTAISSWWLAAQTQCMNNPFIPISVTATGPGLTYQWYSNATNSNSGGTSLGSDYGAQTNGYTPQSATAGTLYYYCKVTGTCGTTATSAVSGAFITNATTAINSQSTATQTQCSNGTFSAISVTATGTGSLTYQWYSNASNSNSGGASLGSGNGAQTNSYTPQTSAGGTLYYYCVVTGTCGTATSSVSGAFIVNPLLTVTSFSPNTGPAGTLVTITGTNLNNTSSFTIGGVPALIVSNTATSLVGMVMPWSTGTISITNGGCSPVSAGTFTITPTLYPGMQQGEKILGTGNTGAALQGTSVAVSADGNTAIVGGMGDNSDQGAVWVYTRSGSTWTQQGDKLVGTGSVGEFVYQGFSVSLSADGNTAMVGGYGDNSNMGAAWVFTRSGSTWTQQGDKLVGTGTVGSTVYQGNSVSLSADGNTALVGGYGDNSNLGATWVYTRSGSTWTQQGNKLVGTGSVGEFVYQGFSVSLSGDGNRAIVGGMYDNNQMGAAWLFNRSGSTWTQQGGKLLGAGTVGTDVRQGCSVSLSADGSTAIVGGYNDNYTQGAAWVYAPNMMMGGWAQQGNKLVGTDNTGTAYQGSSVSLSADGSTAIVGGMGDNSNKGAVWVYTRSGQTWSQQDSKLVGTGSVGADVKQGCSVSISADGNTAMVGGYFDDSYQGAAWVFIVNPPTWTGTTSTNWNTASNWSPAAVPTAGANATIPSAPVNQPQVNNDPGSPAICNNLTIQTGAVLTIAPGKALTVNNTLTNNTGTGGLIVQSDASGTGSLIHNSDAVDATIQRYISGSGTLTDMQYHFVSVPLVTATASTSNLFLDSYLFDYTQASGTWNALGSATTNNLDETRGYMIYYPGTSKTYSFAGQLNNGAFTALTSYTLGQGYNLVPNPYPSAIDWMGSGWTKTAIADATYIWPAGADGLSTNYSSFVAGVGSNAGTRYIPAGQAFFVQATGSSPVLTMTNASRVHNAQAFWKEGEQISDLLRIKAVAVHNQAFDELVVHFREGASANFDIDFDANKLRGGEDAPQFSSVAADNSRLSINSLPFSGGDIIVPLAFSLNTGSDVTLTASGMGSFYESTPIYLEDLTTNTITDLRVNPVYTFSHAAGDNENRFRLRFKGVTGTPEQPITTPGNIFISQGQLFVDVPSMNQLPATLAVYDALGRQFSSCKVTLNGIMQCTAPSIPGVYVVRLIAGSRSFTGKVVVGK